MDSRSGFGFAWNLEHFQNERLCHGTVLTALRGAYRFTPAQAAIFIAARQPVFHSPLPPCRITVRRGDAPQFAALAPPVVKDMFNTVFYD